MVRGLYTSASGALVAESMANNVANNLANVTTSGFKRTLFQIQSAPTMQIYRIQTDPGQVAGNPLPGVPAAQYVGVLGTGSQIYDTPTDFAQGPLQSTGNSLDLALTGTGNAFFNVQTPNGVRYTRNGEFVKNAQGYLCTQDGNPVLSTQGQTIQLQDQGRVAVAPDGTISQNGLRVAQLQLTQFNSLLNVRPQGANLYMMSGNAGPSTATGAAVQQGFLEKSNGNVVTSMVDLINAERWFQANETSINAQDNATNQAITTVSKSISG